jgi:NADH-quinone oxidoreductase subunit C
VGDEAEVAAETMQEVVAPAATRYGMIDAGGGVLHAVADTYLEGCAEARADGFGQLIDLTAVDYLTYGAPRNLPAAVEAERFEIVTQLINHSTRERIRIRTQVNADEPVLPTLFDLWPGAENLEREVYDMFGIEFTDHPDMSRVLMPEEWVGHPLRKDYAIGSIPVQFKAASDER